LRWRELIGKELFDFSPEFNLFTLKSLESTLRALE